MAERITAEMGLTKPREFKTKNGTGYEFTNLDGEAFVCFDGTFVEAFSKNELAGQVREYAYLPANDPKQKPMLVAIPGLHEGKPQWKGGGRSGPMLSDAQVALLFCRGIEEFEPVADRALAWLRTQGSRVQPASEPASSTRPAPPPVSNGNGVGEHLLTLAAEAFGNRPKLAEAFLQSAAKRFGAEIPNLSEGQVAEITSELERKIEQRQT